MQFIRYAPRAYCKPFRSIPTLPGSISFGSIPTLLSALGSVLVGARHQRHQRHQRPSPASPAPVTSTTSARYRAPQRPSSSTPVPVTNTLHQRHQRPSPSPAPVTVPDDRHRARRPSPCLTVLVHAHPCTRILSQGFHRVTRLSNTSPTLSSYPEAR
ncbi:hypothetical protein CRG98_040533 [Punica granatum]|uniref:Uncharacterized protein n=1 Tax=Punica granatum TaxID=22663 RepID=A0A2I0I6N1_PUNGR|nr:hypothetical protein CRG98_040533 [Punica granatum]